MPAPEPGWTWDDFTATALKLTDPAKGIFGTGWPADGGEDCVWRIYPLIWDLGGDIVTKAGRRWPSTTTAASRRWRPSTSSRKDKSVYPDTKPGSETMYQIFNNNKMGMIPTGPWQLPNFIENKTEYGVVPAAHVLRRQRHHRRARHLDGLRQRAARMSAAVKFLTYLTEAAQDVQWAARPGACPLRSSTAQSPEWKAARQPRRSVWTCSPRRSRMRGPGRPSARTPDLPAHGAGDRADAAGPGHAAGRAARGRADARTPRLPRRDR